MVEVRSRGLFAAMLIAVLLSLIWVARMEMQVLSGRHKHLHGLHVAHRHHHGDDDVGALPHDDSADGDNSDDGSGSADGSDAESDSGGSDNGSDAEGTEPPQTPKPHHHHPQHQQQQHHRTEKPHHEHHQTTKAPSHHEAQKQHHGHGHKPGADHGKHDGTPEPAKHHHHHGAAVGQEGEHHDAQHAGEKHHHAPHDEPKPPHADDADGKHHAAEEAGRHHHHHRHQHRGDYGAQGVRKVEAMGEGSVAFAVVVSNEEFVDGALTLAWSFRNHSKLFSTGHARLVLIAPNGALCSESLQRLEAVGWKDQRIVQDLTPQAGRSVWAGTFNKLYLFSLTEYERVAYFDVDMLMLRSPDDVFATDLPDAKHIGALGNSDRSHKAYFQTGMMLLIPTKDAFDTMMHDFKTRKENRGVNGRDGPIVRRYYGDRYVNLDGALSAHLRVDEPLNSVIGFHFRGSWKPWFDRSKPPKVDPRKGKVAEREIGEAYGIWWKTYEDLHRKVLAPLPLSAAERDPGHVVPAGFDPKTQVWLMRHTPDSYVQPLAGGAPSQQGASKQGTRNLTVPGLALEVSLKGESCDFVCGIRQAVCFDEFLEYSDVNNCERLKAHFGCKSCVSAVPSAVQPSLDLHTHKCEVNSLIEMTHAPRCAEVSQKHRRLCPCLPLVHAAGAVKAIPASEGGRIPSAHDGSASNDVQRTLDTDGAERRKPCDGRFTSAFGDQTSDADCVAKLSKVAQDAVSVGALPVSLYAGVTLKLLATFTDGTRAIIKLPQPGFPHEPQSEVAAFHVDRLLGAGRVPPTAHAWVPRTWLENAMGNTTSFTQNAGGLPPKKTAASSTPRVQKASDVRDYWATRSDIVRTQAGVQQVAVSVQLVVDDVHRLEDSTLALPENYERWFAVGDAVERPVSDHDVDIARRVLPAMADTVLFDFIIDNSDRATGKNLFVAGGCKTYCVNSFIDAHVGDPALVWIDQGHSFYDAAPASDSDGASATSSTRNALAVAVEDDSASKSFCRLSKTSRAALETLGAVGDDGDTVDGFASKVIKSLRDGDAGDVVDIIGEDHFVKAQSRVQQAAKHFQSTGCAADDAAFGGGDGTSGSSE